MTEDEMVGWHHQLNGHESEQSPGPQRVGHDLATEWQQLGCVEIFWCSEEKSSLLNE